MRKSLSFLGLIAALFLIASCGNEYHVSVHGDDGDKGSRKEPFRTIQRAADAAVPGDEVIVHGGVYRERITPPRGGSSDRERITFRAASGDKVEIKGSEILGDWEALGKGIWKAGVPNSLFGDHNPFATHVEGDWLVDGYWVHTGDLYLNGRALFEVQSLDEVLRPRAHERALDQEAALFVWYVKVGRQQTTFWVNFHDVNPDEELVEISVRESCFYPDSVGRNYITLDGFHFSHAATQWAPPSAEQVGMVGCNWSRGWIIRNCTLHDTKCNAITLGKDRASGHNGWEPGTSGADHYNRIVVRAIEVSSWSLDSVGGHLVENNHIYNCEQTGICGSLGPVLSIIRGNHIHDIWTRRQFFGYEIAAIKFHAPIDALIQGNILHDAHKGLWMDWMTQGTRISANLCFNNEFADLFSEVNHGPYMVDNNIFLSGLQNWSESGAFVHNLIAGPLQLNPVPDRSTPYMEAHSTSIKGLSETVLGDDRWFNNIFIGDSADSLRGLSEYSRHANAFPVQAAANVYLGKVLAMEGEDGALHIPDAELALDLEVLDEAIYLRFSIPDTLAAFVCPPVQTGMLGRAVRTGMQWEWPDGSPLHIDHDYFGEARYERPYPGPFQDPGTGEVVLRVGLLKQDN